MTLRYFKTDNEIFAIPTHYTSYHLSAINKEAKIFADTLDIDVSEIQVHQIEQSSRYRGMTAYRATKYNNLPEDTFEPSEDWTMWSWINW